MSLNDDLNALADEIGDVSGDDKAGQMRALLRRTTWEMRFAALVGRLKEGEFDIEDGYAEQELRYWLAVETPDNQLPKTALSVLLFAVDRQQATIKELRERVGRCERVIGDMHEHLTQQGIHGVAMAQLCVAKGVFSNAELNHRQKVLCAQYDEEVNDE